MKVGIIAEGKSDLAVLTNILKGVKGVDLSDVIYLVPELEYDETDLKMMPENAFSNWTIVKKKCQDGRFLSDFFAVEGERFLVIHIDTAERLEAGYDVSEPQKTKDNEYVEKVRAAVKTKILSWLPEDYHDKATFAVAVEEIDAWVLTLFENQTQETGHYPRPKERLERAISARISKKEIDRQHFGLNRFDQYYNLTTPFRKPKGLNQYRGQNKSLDLFCQEIEQIDIQGETA